MCTMTVNFKLKNLVSIPSIKPSWLGNENSYRLSKTITITIFTLIEQYNNVNFPYKFRKLFIKNEKQRITIDEILKMPFIKKHMATFVEDQ